MLELCAIGEPKRQDTFYDSMFRVLPVPTLRELRVSVQTNARGRGALEDKDRTNVCRPGQPGN